jgi:site-specific recombinase XerD
VRLHGKGDKWRHCPLWNETASILRRLIEAYRVRDPQGHVFRAATGKPLTRFGLYKRVRRLTANLIVRNSMARNAHISPHVFRRTAAVHLLEAGVDVNVIRGWLGHRLCLFRAVTNTVMACKSWSGFQQNWAVESTCSVAGTA